MASYEGCHAWHGADTAEATTAHTYYLPRERLAFCLQSEREEYTFTNRGLIITSGVTSSHAGRCISRLQYDDATITQAQVETGQETKLNLTMGGKDLSILIAQDSIVDATQYAQVLRDLGKIQKENHDKWALQSQALLAERNAAETNGMTQDERALFDRRWNELDELLNPTCYGNVIENALRRARGKVGAVPNGAVGAIQGEMKGEEVHLKPLQGGNLAP